MAVSGAGLAAVLRQLLPRPVVYPAVFALVAIGLVVTWGK